MAKSREVLPVKINTNMFVYKWVNGREYKQMYTHHIEYLKEVIGEYGEDIVCLTFAKRGESDDILVVDHRTGGNTRIVKYPLADLTTRLRKHTNSSTCIVNDSQHALVLSKIIVIFFWHRTNDICHEVEVTSKSWGNWNELQSHYLMYAMQENRWSFQMVYVRWLHSQRHAIHTSWHGMILAKPSSVWDSNGDFICVRLLQKNGNQIEHLRFLKEQNFTEYIASLLQISPFKTTGIYPISAGLMIVPHSNGVNGLHSINQLYCRGSKNNLQNDSVAPDRRPRFVLDIDADYKLFLDKHNRLIAWPLKAKSSLAMIFSSY
jgi:hypothetical protein